MKHIILLFVLLLLSCGNRNNKETNVNDNREQQLATLESEMINFFQATLEKNYGIAMLLICL
ncbi:hypothetical protein [Bacteroides bouchesdurhonensis]|uniref:hypothetical protein n=1 Tax=Bacteroides bouchesdurhonensis TaxID=1841855 RepID=UPI00097FA45E|nr:hypothetical protein [Bacteroides bouchesdurhonensis]